MLLIVTSRYPTEKYYKCPELLPHFGELLPPEPRKQGIGALIGRIFEVLIHPKNWCLANAVQSDLCFRKEQEFTAGGDRSGIFCSHDQT
jgi:hypothetical protein